MTFSHVWKNRSEFFLEWDISQIKVVNKIKTRFMSGYFLSENRAVCKMWSQRDRRQYGART